MGEIERIADIERLRELLKRLRPLNAGEARRLAADFSVEYTYNSNAIEGSTVTLRETALIINEGVTIGGKSVREHLDAIGHGQAFGLIMDMAARGVPLSEALIKQAHSLVLMGDRENAGVYRGVSVRIGGSKASPAPPAQIAPMMDLLVSGYAAQDPAEGAAALIESIARFHLAFEDIHPFIDGNGRTGRLILNLELIKAGLLPVDIKFIDRDKYYYCFERYHDTGGCAALAELLAGYEARELARYIDILKRG